MIYSIMLTWNEIHLMRDTNETVVKIINDDEYHIHIGDSDEQHDEIQTCGGEAE